jgi:hypothetical protein
MIEVKCGSCNKIFLTYPCKIKKGDGKYCSRKCYWKSIEGKRLSPKTEFKKGMTNWCTGKKGDVRFMGNNNPSWKNGKYKHSQGYIFIYQPEHPFASKNHILEHRLVVEKQIGRYLLPKEKVHHLGKKDDNRPCMLMAFINQSAHIRFERHCIVKLHEIIFDGRCLHN